MGQGWGEAKGPTPHESAQDRLRRAARAHVDADTPDTLRALSRALEDVERDGVVGNSLVGVPSRAGGFVMDPSDADRFELDGGTIDLGIDPTPPDALGALE